MLVYGDHRESADPGSLARDIHRRLERIERITPGIERHARLVAVLVDAGRLMQGIADAEFARDRRDGRTDSTDRLGAFLLALGKAVCRSWDSSFQQLAQMPRLELSGGLPRQVELREPEGFAFYAVYPEAYAEAARRLTLSAPPRVIGLRSIGTSLAAIVAAALNAPPPITVRPFGDPFARTIAVDPALERELLDGDAHYVIVDEGPGQSGSSFGAAGDWLQERGVPSDRIAVLPSHAGEPGPAATEERRGWWTSVQREVADFADRWPALLQSWCTKLLGPVDGIEDISAGAWRKLHFTREDEWPATVVAWERRKFLVRAGGRRFLVKFAGLGRIGEEKLTVARALHSERLVPEPFGLVHGFLVERWCEDASPLDPHDTPLREIARYIASRAKLLPAPRGSGASVEELLTMARRNVSLEFGGRFARAFDGWSKHAAELEHRIVRVRTDDKLDRHEWLRTGAGALIKSDALDHHRAHDLIGCQDVAWDVAGAIAEFDLAQDAARRLIGWIEEEGCRIDRDLLEFARVAYLAFRTGHARLGAAPTGSGETERLRRLGDRYSAQLQLLLESACAATRLESSVG